MGAPGIGPNAIAGFKGYYAFDGIKAEVFFTREKIPVFSSWGEIEAGGFSVFTVEEEKLYFYSHREQWSVFISFSDRSPFQVPFIEKFISELIFFARDGTGFALSSFPAVITP